MKYVLAVVACVALGLLYAFLGAALFNWQHGGGYVPMAILFGVMVATWRFITRDREEKAQTRTSAIASPVFGSKKMRDATPQDVIDDSPLYAAALKECDGGDETRQASTWAKAFSTTEGDENRARAKYIELRVAELLAQEEKRLQRDRIEDLRREIGSQGAQMSEAQLEFATRYPIGRDFPVLYKHFGNRVTRMPVETDARYAARLRRFARDLEKGRS